MNDKKDEIMNPKRSRQIRSHVDRDGLRLDRATSEGTVSSAGICDSRSAFIIKNKRD